MDKLDTRQINMLMTGQSLAIEIASTSNSMRAFVVIGAYKRSEHIGGARLSKYLNSPDKSEAIFWLRKYEIKRQYVDDECYVSDDELVNSVFMDNIKDISQLERELSKYLCDYSRLDAEWKCDNPI